MNAILSYCLPFISLLSLYPVGGTEFLNPYSEKEILQQIKPSIIRRLQNIPIDVQKYVFGVYGGLSSQSFVDIAPYTKHHVISNSEFDLLNQLNKILYWNHEHQLNQLPEPYQSFFKIRDQKIGDLREQYKNSTSTVTKRYYDGQLIHTLLSSGSYHEIRKEIVFLLFLLQRVEYETYQLCVKELNTYSDRLPMPMLYMMYAKNRYKLVQSIFKGEIPFDFEKETNIETNDVFYCFEDLFCLNAIKQNTLQSLFFNHLSADERNFVLELGAARLAMVTKILFTEEDPTIKEVAQMEYVIYSKVNTDNLPNPLLAAWEKFLHLVQARCNAIDACKDQDSARDVYLYESQTIYEFYCKNMPYAIIILYAIEQLPFEVSEFIDKEKIIADSPPKIKEKFEKIRSSPDFLHLTPDEKEVEKYFMECQCCELLKLKLLPGTIQCH